MPSLATARWFLIGCAILTGVIRGQEPAGRLMLIGGAERDDNHLLWDEFVRLAGGPGSSIAILATASSYPENTAKLFAAHFERMGLRPFVLPAASNWPGFDLQEVVHSNEWAARIEQAGAVFLAGGEQGRYRKAFVAADGTEVPLLQAIRRMHARGGLVAGTSAGMAVMSRIMFIDADQVLPVMLNGATLGQQIDYGLGLLPDQLFVDQHFLARGRFGRALVVMQDHNFPYGLGVDEDTALIIEGDRQARVVGYRGVLLMDASDAVRDPSRLRFHWNGVKLSFLSHGDRLDLREYRVHPGPEKIDAYLVDPKSPKFRPYYPYRQYYNDILGNTQLLDLMYKLVDSPHDEAIGLAFDGLAAQSSPANGFRFRFYRTDRTVSWDSSIALGDPHTVLDVSMDIEPIVVEMTIDPK